MGRGRQAPSPFVGRKTVQGQVSGKGVSQCEAYLKVGALAHVGVTFGQYGGYRGTKARVLVEQATETPALRSVWGGRQGGRAVGGNMSFVLPILW